jgi:hypothetical protein
MSYVIFRHGLGQLAPTIQQAVERMEERLTHAVTHGRFVDFNEPCILTKGTRKRAYVRTYRIYKKGGAVVLRPAEWYQGQRDDLVGVPLEQIHEMEGR